MAIPIEVPPTLIPVQRGRVIDWKATAIREHIAFVDSYTNAARTSKLTDLLQNEIATLSQDLGDVLASNRRQEAIFRSIRAHWSSIFLPRHLR